MLAQPKQFLIGFLFHKFHDYIDLKTQNHDIIPALEKNAIHVLFDNASYLVSALFVLSLISYIIYEHDVFTYVNT